MDSIRAKSVVMMGRQPAIGRAELESLLGAEALQPLGEQAVACRLPAEDVPFTRLGSATRLASVVAVLPTHNWAELSRYVLEELPARCASLPPGKLKLGLSVFDLPVKAPQLLRTGLELKKRFQKTGRSVRIVPTSGEGEAALSTAQVLHNQLTGPLGLELLFIRSGHQTYVAQTQAVQDITAYAARDQKRPKRDPRVGMLPPKLAQIIINLAAASSLPVPHSPCLILDPFCGTGVILQEAALMGYQVYGSDIEPRMVDFSAQNLAWLAHHFQTTAVEPPKLELGDATAHRWQPTPNFVATEAYLGAPLTLWPSSQNLRQIINTCNLIIEKFLKNLAPQIPTDTRLCVAVPAWQAPSGQQHHLPLLDHLGELGYNRVSFSWAKSAELVYRRPEQLVARELVVLTRK